MAKDRARRRAIRENERLERIALAKEKQRKLLERAQRREAITKKFSIKVQPGTLARRRRRRFVLSIFFLFMLNILFGYCLIPVTLDFLDLHSHSSSFLLLKRY